MERPRRRRNRRLRRILAPLVVALPTAWVVGADLVRRHAAIRAFDHDHRLAYLGSIGESLVFWGVLVFPASGFRPTIPRKIATVLFVALFTIVVGVEDAFRAFWNIYLSIDGQLHSKSIPWSILGTLPIDRAVLWVHLAAACGFALAVVWLGRTYLRVRGWPSYVVSLAIPAACYAVTRIPVSYRQIQSTAYDMIYFHGMTALVKERLGLTHDSPDLRVQRRDPEPVPALTPKPARPRNVILILQESQRADVVCVDYDPDCPLATRFSNRAAKDRYPLLEMRANDSTTAISISNIWSGVVPTERRDVLHSVPLLWEYAHAAGLDTAYWTSQNLMFGNARLYVQDIPVSRRAVATDLDSQAPLDEGTNDMLATDRALAELEDLKEPFFAVVHYSNIHYPYVYDEKEAPFQPADFDKSADKNDEFKNYYKDVVYLSDKAVGKLIDGIHASKVGPRTVMLYTSDHGESFREHWQLGHTSSIYDEEIHVPGWIDAPPGTLSPEEEASIKAAKHQYLWHLDLAPTFLDLMGLWDDPALAPFRKRMMGHPITRPERTIEPVPLTNCTWVWECAFRNWGMMQGPMKLEAREWDGEYHCFNVRDDPEEQTNLGEAGCGPLADLARGIFPEYPDVTPPGRPVVDWGKK